MALAVMSAGAAKVRVTRLRPAFVVETGSDLDAVFGAVGTLRDEFVAGHRCDVLILSQSLIDEFVADGKLVQRSVAAVGLVRTGLAAGADEPAPMCRRRTPSGAHQTTEVLNTQGVRLIGTLPGELSLTTYTAAVTSNAADPGVARRLVSMLTAESSKGLRRDCGFEF
ncbi:MAG: hypothetical protein ACR2P2_11665 [Nakamurella sp.]